MLLNGQGKEFIEWYYEYIQKIFDQRVPLAEIASKSKVKLSIEDYIKRSKQTTKAGNLNSRMAHMELAIHHNLNVNLGDVITYVNNGLRASHGDVVKKADSLVLNCYLLDPAELEANPDFCLLHPYGRQPGSETY